MAATSFRRIGVPLVYVGSFALVPFLAIGHDLVSGFESTADWLTGLCALGGGAATVAMLHAVIGRH
jgi:hypothetical protein